MKLMIEIQEILKLTEQQVNNLKNWYKNKGFRIGDCVYYKNIRNNLLPTVEVIVAEINDNLYENDVIPILNIGQMIQFLCDSEFGFPRIGLTESKNRSEIIVVSVLCLNGSKYHGKQFESDELCDALWEAVRHMLGA